MKSVLAVLAVLAAASLFFGGCAPAVGVNRKAAAASGGGARAADAVDPRERYAGGGGRTFLDTLNQGKEIALSSEDLPALELSGEGVAQPAGETRFRVQILASSQIDMVRKEKISAEAAINQPVFMASEQSLYKLYVGDFKTKAEAEAILPEVKSKGYQDAWVVSTNTTQN